MGSEKSWVGVREGGGVIRMEVKEDGGRGGVRRGIKREGEGEERWGREKCMGG